MSHQNGKLSITLSPAPAGHRDWLLRPGSTCIRIILLSAAASELKGACIWSSAGAAAPRQRAVCCVCAAESPHELQNAPASQQRHSAPMEGADAVFHDALDSKRTQHRRNQDGDGSAHKQRHKDVSTAQTVTCGTVRSC